MSSIDDDEITISYNPHAKQGDWWTAKVPCSTSVCFSSGCTPLVALRKALLLAGVSSAAKRFDKRK